MNHIFKALKLSQKEAELLAETSAKEISINDKPLPDRLLKIWPEAPLLFGLLKLSKKRNDGDTEELVLTEMAKSIQDYARVFREAA